MTAGTNFNLPKGITRVIKNPPASAASVAANVRTAADMTSLGQEIETAAAWLLTQLPGVFADIEAATAAIKKLA